MPGVQDRKPGSGEIANIAGHQNKAKMQCRRAYDQIGLRKSMADFPTFFDKKTPAEHNIFRDRQDALFKFGADSMFQPVGEFQTTGWIGLAFDTEANFCECYRAHKQAFS